MGYENWVVFCQFASLWFLTGLIWIVQLVHYPAFSFIEQSEAAFTKFCHFHVTRISVIVGPVMLVDLLSGFLLLNIDSIPLVWSSLNFMALIAIWLSTSFLSIPCHNKLFKGYNSQTIYRLIWSNWPRTILWTMRAVALTFFIASEISFVIH